MTKVMFQFWNTGRLTYSKLRLADVFQRKSFVSYTLPRTLHQQKYTSFIFGAIL